MKAKTKLIVLNALITGLIAFVASLPIRIPSSILDVMTNFYAGMIGFLLAFLPQLKYYFEKEIAEEEVKGKKRKRNPRNPRVGMLVWGW